MSMTQRTLAAALIAALGLSCSPPTAAPQNGPAGAKADDGDEGRVASADLIFLDFEFDGVLVTEAWGATSLAGQQDKIQRQLFYTVGQLNGDTSVGRLDRVALSAIQRTELPDNMVELRYHAKMLVGWGKTPTEPPTYVFRLPRDLSYSGESAFVAAFGATCAEQPSDHEIDTESMWYYYRPRSYGCAYRNAASNAELPAAAQGKVEVIPVTVTRSAEETSDRYPEYHRVWSDDALQVVAVYGKYEDAATESSDAGIGAYNSFVSTMLTKLGSLGALTTIPATIPRSPGTGTSPLADITFRVGTPAGKQVQVVAMLVDNIRHTSTAFDERFAVLTQTADVVGYNGHSGLGANIQAMARKGTWIKGQYVIAYLNGCDSYAYVDGALERAHAAPVNPDDPTGTKYVDTMVNAMPSYFSNMDDTMVALVDGLMSYVRGNPLSWVDLLDTMPESQRALVTGEEDNEFVPGTPPPPPPPPANPCAARCGDQSSFGCYCDVGCGRSENGDCCQADGSKGADQGFVKQSCPELFPG